jgi:3-deoxy-D-manno-octulosonic-acid transferase
MIYATYTVGLAALVAAYTPVAVWRRLSRGVPLHVRDRLARRTTPASPPRSAWLHAVSVGEAVAATPLVDGLRRLWPQLPLVVTTVTDTGARVVRDRFGHLATHRFFPLDFPGSVRRAFQQINPAFLICMETELWPNVLREAQARGVPVMIANGRLSDRSFRRYRVARRLMPQILDHVRVFAMQSQEDARRMLALGARPERVFVTGNLKHDAAPDPAGAVELWYRLLGLGRDQRVWIAGSTHRGEEALVLDAHAAALARWPGLTLIMAPRHPERVAEVTALVASRGWTAVRRSELPRAGGANGAPPPVIVIDTVGELAQLYGIADVVFVGGSLVEIGGHNVLEPALRHKPVLFGPHTGNFREAAALLRDSGGGVEVRDGAALTVQLGRLLEDDAARVTIGAAAFAAASSRHGAVKATLELVARFLVAGAPAP